ncbi:MAG: response regulator, partial [Alphaproteobacteria bacterium]
MAALDPHLLVVDDDPRIRVLLRRFLQRHGYRVTEARDGDHARRLLAGLAFDLIVLDVMLPGIDGMALCRELRAAGLGTPILLLTARGETEDRIAGLEAGADDYLPKPFEPRELLARIHAILRRAPSGPGTPLGADAVLFGPWRFEPASGRLTRAGAEHRLTAAETALLRALAERPGEAVDRGRLAEALARGDERPQERAVDVQITRLRRKLEDDPREPRYLQTVRGRGYML